MTTSRPNLAHLDAAYDAAPAEDETVPDGKYLTKVESVELTTSKKQGTPMLKWTLVITAPEHVGRKLWRYNLLATEDNAAWLKKDLHRCGVDLARLSDLPDQLDRLLDLHLSVTKRTNGEYENVYINRLAEGVRDEPLPY